LVKPLKIVESSCFILFTLKSILFILIKQLNVNESTDSIFFWPNEGCFKIYDNEIFNGNILKEEVGASCTIRYIYLGCLFFLMMLIIVLNYTSTDVIKGNKQMSLTIYFVVVFLLIFGLLLFYFNLKWLIS
jgi:hypothetical protein